MKYELVEWTNKKGKKVMRYPVLYGKARRQEKREEAEERQKEYDKSYPTLEKKLDAAGGEKHRAKLLKKLKKAKK
tara:strand:+ start:1402 stop:1626 length:225 start_codon:yes stop_codon:yes gene_type:complete